MADDKTAAEHAADERYPLLSVEHPVARRDGFVAGAAWQAGQPAVRRVAPDRETVAQALFGHDFYPNLIDFEVAQLDRVMAVLVPADQRTADRETLLGLIRTWASEDSSEEVYADLERLADAVLAVLVPADQVRAETLEAARRALRGEFEPLTTRTPDWRNVDRLLADGVAEYRKAAGA